MLPFNDAYERFQELDPETKMPDDPLRRGLTELMYSEGLYQGHRQLGHPVLYPDLTIAEMLADHTDLDLTADFPELPHDVLWIAFPQGFDVQIGSKTQRRCSGCYVAKHKSGAWFFYLYAPSPNKKNFEQSLWFRFTLVPGKPLTSYMGSTVTEYDELQVSSTKENPYYEAQARTTRLLFGLLQYLECSNADVETSTPEDREREFDERYKHKKNKNKGRAGHERRQLDVFGHSTIVYVGRKVGQSAESKAFQEASSAKRRMHLVRGHRRHQACGTGRKDRRWIFVPPHIRGGKEADLDKLGAVTYRFKEKVT